MILLLVGLMGSLLLIRDSQLRLALMVNFFIVCLMLLLGLWIEPFIRNQNWYL